MFDFIIMIGLDESRFVIFWVSINLDSEKCCGDDWMRLSWIGYGIF